MKHQLRDPACATCARVVSCSGPIVPTTPVPPRQVGSQLNSNHHVESTTLACVQAGCAAVSETCFSLEEPIEQRASSLAREMRHPAVVSAQGGLELHSTEKSPVNSRNACGRISPPGPPVLRTRPVVFGACEQQCWLALPERCVRLSERGATQLGRL